MDFLRSSGCLALGPESPKNVVEPSPINPEAETVGNGVVLGGFHGWLSLNRFGNVWLVKVGMDVGAR